MAIHNPADSSVKDLLDRMVASYYPDIEECQTKIGIMMVYPSPGKIDKPALLENGYPVDAKPRIVSYQDRVAGLPDVVIYLDGPNWHNVDDTERDSILDRALYRLEVRRDKKTKAIMTDDRARPLMKLKRYDYRVQGYNLIVHRYGRDGVDAKAIEELSLHYNTLLPVNTGKVDNNDDLESSCCAQQSTHEISPSGRLPEESQYGQDTHGDRDLSAA